MHSWLHSLYWCTCVNHLILLFKVLHTQDRNAHAGPYTQTMFKNVIVFFIENQISKWRSFEKRAIFDLLFTFRSTREKLQNFFSTYLTHIHTCILFTLLTFLPYKFWKKKKKLAGMVFLWYDSWCWFIFAPFWNNQ